MEKYDKNNYGIDAAYTGDVLKFVEFIEKGGTEHKLFG